MLSREKAEIFHSINAKVYFMQWINTRHLTYTCNLMQQSEESKWGKCKKNNQADEIFERKREMVLNLSAENTNTTRWYVDAAFVVHPDFKIGTGTTMTMGKREVISIYTRENIVKISRKEAILWTNDTAYYVKRDRKSVGVVVSGTLLC